jgi:hypothetical protein
MRPSNKSRSRNKPGNNGNSNNNNNNQRRSSMGNIINRVFESAGPDGKVRGTPQQIIDKYQALARDAQVSGDRVAAESYLQHSEHYSRLLGEAQRAQQEVRVTQERDNEREDGSFEQRRQPQAPQPVASGLTTIDSDDGFDSGPIETPEGRRGGFDDNAGFSRRDRDRDRDRDRGEQRMNDSGNGNASGNANGNGSGNGYTVPEAAQAQAPAPAPEPAPTPQPAPARRKPSPAPEAAEKPAPAPVAEAVAAPEQQPLELQLAEPQAEPVKKPRARRRKTQPAVTAAPEEAAPAAQPEPAESE